MKKSFLNTLFCLVIILLAIEGQAQSVKTDYNTKTDFKKYKTYAWMAPGDTVLNGRRPDKLYAGSIMLFANEELKKKGLTMVSIEPEVVFVFHTRVDERTVYSQSPTLSVGVGVAGPGYYVGGYAPVAGGEITEKQVEDGILAFDMYDTKTRELVWT
ncbi:MAG TPA: DUF4136 domain-containing protein, partial [Chryseolinea sp.]|nr:DUF4136 domain-containing protein [Chryseolinea sp.]